MLILDEFAAHLERWGEFPAFDREFLIEQRDFLDLLVRREVSGHFVDFLLEVLDDSRVARQLGVVFGLDAERFRIRPQRVEGRDDQRRGEFSGVADDYGLLDHRDRADQVLDRLRRDVFAQAGLDQVFLAVGNADVAVGVDRPDVAGVKPDAVRAPLQDPFGLLGHLVIALHDVIALNQQLPVFGGADFDPGNRLADRADAVRLGAVERDHWRGFGQPVALQDRDAGPGEDVGQIGRQSRAARNEEAQPSADGRAPFREDQPVERLQFEREPDRNSLPLVPDRGHLAPDLQGAVKYLLFHRRLFGGSLVDRGVDLLEEAGHGGDDRRADLFDVFGHSLDPAREIDLDAEAHVNVEHRALEDVRERQEAESRIVGPQVEDLAGAERVRDQVAVREHHAFRLARRAGGVNDRREIVGVRLPRGLFVKLRMRRSFLPPGLFQISKNRHGAVFLPFLPFLRRLEHDQSRTLFTFERVERRLDAAQLFGVRDEEYPRAAVSQDVSDLVHSLGGINGHVD